MNMEQHVNTLLTVYGEDLNRLRNRVGKDRSEHPPSLSEAWGGKSVCQYGISDDGQAHSEDHARDRGDETYHHALCQT